MKTISHRERILIVGGGGFVGANLARKLLDLGYDVHLLWRDSSNPWRLKDIKQKIKFHIVDIQNKKALTTLIKKIYPTAIFHLASHSAYRNQEDIEKIIETSINGTLNLLLASKDIPYKVFVNTGSSSEYGFKKKPMKENDLLEPISFYAAAKAGQTFLCQAFSYQYNKPIVTLRPFSVYGQYEQTDRFIPTIVKAIIEKKPIQLTEGKQRRDFIYVDDMVNAYVKLLKKGNKLAGKILNIGTGKEYTNDKIVKTLFKISNKKTLIEKGKFPKRIWDSPHWVADISEAKKLLNWYPKFTLEEGLKKTYNWYLKNSNLYDKQ
jgi:nucleoside-diphosphate-sugar epimerase